MEELTKLLETIAGFVWGPFLLIPLLLLTGLWLTIKLRGIQFRTLGSALRLALWERKDADAVAQIDCVKGVYQAELPLKVA